MQRMALPGASGPASGGAVQRLAPAAGGGAAPGVAARRMVHAAPAVVQRMDATAPPVGGPPAELPTMTAGDAPGTRAAGGMNAEELAEQVYGLLVRRLESERKQRGW